MTKRENRKSTLKKNLNQLAFDFTKNVPIEIHIPRNIAVNFNKEIFRSKKSSIELVRG
ncbi:MAG: hypothetical protein P8Y79_08510 [Ignavibacteriaceae bacterium]|jgi:hypothetical protein